MDAHTRLLLDKDEIRDLVFLYPHRIVTQDWRGIADTFTEDGILDYSNVATFARSAQATQAERDAGSSLVFVGRDAIRNFLPAVGRLDVKAFFTNHLIRVTGDTGVGISFFENRVTQRGESVLGAGRMFDEYRRVNGRWLFAYRRQEVFFFTGLKEGWAEGPDRDRRPAPITRRGWEDDLLGSGGLGRDQE